MEKIEFLVNFGAWEEVNGRYKPRMLSLMNGSFYDELEKVLNNEEDNV